MSKVNITNILQPTEPQLFTNEFQFQIFMDVLQPLQEPIHFKIVYVGCSEDPSRDQILSEKIINCQNLGPQQINWTLPSPNYQLIPTIEDLIGPSALMICAFFNNQEFFRCSYFVYNNRPDGQMITEQNFDITKIYRSVLTDKPRIWIKDIDWEEDYQMNINNQEDQQINNLKMQNENFLDEIDDQFMLKENSYFMRNFNQV